MTAMLSVRFPWANRFTVAARAIAVCGHLVIKERTDHDQQ